MKKTKRIIIVTIFFLLLLAISASLFIAGFYYEKISDEEYVFDAAIDQVFEKAEEMFFIDSDYYIGDSFQVEGTMDLDLSSEVYRKKSETDPEYKKKNQILNNLSQMDITYQFQQDKEKQQVYAEWSAKIGEEEIDTEKRYINNSTQYFFVNKIVSNYVNDGNNNYFEAFTENTTTKDNIDYLYNFLRQSIQKNITKNQIKSYDQKTLLGQEKVDVGLLTYKIDDKEYKRLLKEILNDLKKDKRACEILSVGNYHIEDLKVNTKKRIIKAKETYTINLYLSKPFMKIVKTELVHNKGNNQSTYVIEGTMSKGDFYYSTDGNLRYRAEYQSSKKRTSIIIYDRMDKQVGTIKAEIEKNNKMFMANLTLEEDNYDVSYSIKYKDKKEDSYIREDVLSWKWTKGKEIQLQGTMNAISKVSTDPKIMVDTESSVLKSTLTDTEKQKLETRKEMIKERLEK